MENTNSGKKGFSIFGIIIGVAAIAFAIVIFACTPDSGYYSQDFYDDVFQSVRAISMGTGFLLLFLGLADIAFFGVKLCEKPVVVTQSAPSQPIKKVVDEVPEI